MKKWKFLLLIGIFLLFIHFLSPFVSLSALTMKGLENLFRRPVMRQVFDLDKEEAVAVFGDLEESEFV